MNDDAETPSMLRESAVAVFFNPTAGGGRARFHLAQIQELFESLQVRAQFVRTNNAAELALSAQDAISQRCRVLMAMGGDGTFQTLANAAFGADVLLSVLPVGGGNDFASALGLPGEPWKPAEAGRPGTPRFVALARLAAPKVRVALVSCAA